MSDNRDPAEEQQIADPPRQPEPLRANEGNPNDDRDHLVDAPPTQVDEEKVRENAARGADGDGDA